jgi:hypothetical protein
LRRAHDSDRRPLRHPNPVGGGDRQIAVAGPLLEDEAGRVHEGFWIS